jgi:hypothetical protein
VVAAASTSDELVVEIDVTPFFEANVDEFDSVPGSVAPAVDSETTPAVLHLTPAHLNVGPGPLAPSTEGAGPAKNTASPILDGKDDFKRSTLSQPAVVTGESETSAWSPTLETVWSLEDQPAPVTPAPHMSVSGSATSPAADPELEPYDRQLQLIQHPASMVQSFARTYTRRRKKLQIVVPVQGARTPGSGSTPMRTGTPSPNQRTCFLAKLTKKTPRILPTPRATRLRSHVCTPAAPPRCSRRIAGAAPEITGGGAPSRSKKKVMRALDIIGETEEISQQALEEYSRLFSQSACLSEVHVQAMVALFGWATPDEQDL